jgi:predicted metal-dependent hydrolase
MSLVVGKVTCQVVRTSRRTTEISIERDGSVFVRAPANVDDARLHKVVEKKLPWVYRNLALWNELNRESPKREFVSGETFYVEGIPCILDVRAECDTPLQRVGDRLILRESNRPQAMTHIQAMYRQLGYQRIPTLLERYAKQLGVTHGKLRVWELMNRWASCSTAGNLNFHWRTMTLPRDILEYLVVHELAHLLHRNHTKEFWATVEKVLPNWNTSEKWLRVYGAGRSC